MTPRLSIILPTITGREELLDATTAAYGETVGVEAEIVVVRERSTCGEAWNAGADEAEGDYVLLGADDLVPFPGAVEAAISAADDGIYPSPWITRPDGSTEARGSMGGGMLLGAETPEGTPCNSSPIPFFPRAAWTGEKYPRLGPSLPIHYFADDYLAWRARRSGFRIEVVGAYRFTHLEGTVGRTAVQVRAAEDRDRFLRAVTGIS